MLSQASWAVMVRYQYGFGSPKTCHSHYLFVNSCHDILWTSSQSVVLHWITVDSDHLCGWPFWYPWIHVCKSLTAIVIGAWMIYSNNWVLLGITQICQSFQYCGMGELRPFHHQIPYFPHHHVRLSRRPCQLLPSIWFCWIRQQRSTIVASGTYRQLVLHTCTISGNTQCTCYIHRTMPIHGPNVLDLLWCYYLCG